MKVTAERDRKRKTGWNDKRREKIKVTGQIHRKSMSG